MSNQTRFLLAILGAAVAAALATPELTQYLPPGLAQVLAASLAVVLHKVNAKEDAGAA